MSHPIATAAPQSAFRFARSDDDRSLQYARRSAPRRGWVFRNTQAVSNHQRYEAHRIAWASFEADARLARRNAFALEGDRSDLAFPPDVQLDCENGDMELGLYAAFFRSVPMFRHAYSMHPTLTRVAELGRITGEIANPLIGEGVAASIGGHTSRFLTSRSRPHAFVTPEAGVFVHLFDKDWEHDIELKGCCTIRIERKDGASFVSCETGLTPFSPTLFARGFGTQQQNDYSAWSGANPSFAPGPSLGLFFELARYGKTLSLAVDAGQLRNGSAAESAVYADGVYEEIEAEFDRVADAFQQSVIDAFRDVDSTLLDTNATTPEALVPLATDSPATAYTFRFCRDPAHAHLRFMPADKSPVLKTVKWRNRAKARLGYAKACEHWMAKEAEVEVARRKAYGITTLLASSDAEERDALLLSSCASLFATTPTAPYWEMFTRFHKRAVLAQFETQSDASSQQYLTNALLGNFIRRLFTCENRVAVFVQNPTAIVCFVDKQIGDYEYKVSLLVQLLSRGRYNEVEYKCNALPFVSSQYQYYSKRCPKFAYPANAGPFLDLIGYGHAELAYGNDDLEERPDPLNKSDRKFEANLAAERRTHDKETEESSNRILNDLLRDLNTAITEVLGSTGPKKDVSGERVL